MKFAFNEAKVPRSTTPDRRLFIGGSDARIIMSSDEAALIRALEGKARGGQTRGFIGQSRRPTGCRHRGAQPDLVRAKHGAGHHRHPALDSASCASLSGGDPGWVRQRPRCGIRGQVHAALVVLRRSRRRKAHGPAPAQHVGDQRPVGGVSIITGGGKWVEMTIPADALYQDFLVTAERRFWRCVETGETPRPYGIEPPRPRVEAVRFVEMSGSNSWAEFAGLFCATRSAFLDHERAKTELKALMLEDAKEASGHGVRAKRSNPAQSALTYLPWRTAVQRSSDAIGAIAAAPAKAQAELTNPEKALIATIRAANPREQDQTFRYAALSSGLDIVPQGTRRPRVATVQATANDQEAGLIRLTATLAHSSGEWLSSDRHCRRARSRRA